LERALKFIKDKVIKVEDILASMTTGKSGIKLPKTLNKVTGKMSSGNYKFSFANWHEETESYMKSISSRDEETKLNIIVRTRKLMKKTLNTDFSDDDVEESINNCALICNISFFPHHQHH
ncbi:uncharacterized protein F5147DRAFT_585325, partial [Suillus discolor]